MKIFGTISAANIAESSYQEGSTRGIYGASVACRNFYMALLRHGSFDEYHFFVPGYTSQKHTDENYHFFQFLRVTDRVLFKTLDELQQAFAKSDYFVFHQPGGPLIAPWLYIRNRFNQNNCPITGVTHTLSYQFFLTDILSIVLANPRPWDSIVCAERPAKKVMENLISSVIENLKAQFGIELSYQGRLDEIPLGVDTTTYCPREKALLKRQFGLPEGKTIILWIGRFSQYDKMDLYPLLLAFKKALSEIPSNECALVLAGDDSRHAYAEKLRTFAKDLEIADSVIIRTNLPRSAYPFLFSAADIFVSPSDNIQETFGQTVLEAMASGVPVVASDWEGYHISVIHGETGFRIPTYWMECDQSLCDFAPLSPWMLDHLYLSQSICVDVPSLAQALTILVKNKNLRLAMGEKARKHALQTYDWRVIIGQYEQLWQELHTIAREHEIFRDWQQPWLRPQYFKTFQHYATGSLNEDSQVRISDYGETIREKETPFQWYEEMNAKLSWQLIKDILNLTTDWISLSQLTKQIQEHGALSQENFRYTLLWMVKYNLLDLKPRTGVEIGTYDLSPWAGKETKNLATDFRQVVTDIAEFTNESVESVFSKCAKFTDLTKEEWLRINPETWEQKRNFYRTTRSYIYELAEWHRRAPKIKEMVLDLVEGICLDFGCGIATLSLLGKQQGKTIFAYDIESFTFEFAKFRLRKHHAGHLICEVPQPHTYDTIVCVDVLEHVENPKKMLKDLNTLLKPGGKLIVSALGGTTETHPMHTELTHSMLESYLLEDAGFRFEGRAGPNIIARKRHC